MTQKLLSFTINRLTERFAETNRLRLYAAQHLKNHSFKSNSFGSTPFLSSMMRTFGLGIRTCNPLGFFGNTTAKSKAIYGYKAHWDCLHRGVGTNKTSAGRRPCSVGKIPSGSICDCKLVCLLMTVWNFANNRSPVGNTTVLELLVTLATRTPRNRSEMGPLQGRQRRRWAGLETSSAPFPRT